MPSILPPGTSHSRSLHRQFNQTGEPGAKFDKNIPYFPAKYGRPVSENCTRRHDDQDEATRIVCSNLSTQWLIDNLRDGKVDYARYQGEEIADHVRSDSLDIYQAALRAAKIKVSDNDQIGKHLVDKFAEMESGGKTRAGCFLHSAKHAMALALKIKTIDGVKKYVVTFYDPNATNSHVRLELDPPLHESTLAHLSTIDLLGRTNNNFYFGESNTCSLAFIDQDQMADIVTKAEKEEPILTEPMESKSAECDFTVDTINPTHILHLLYQGCDQNLQDLMPLFQQLQQTNPQKLIDLVVASPSDRHYGLAQALTSKKEKSISAWTAMFKLVPDEEKTAVLQKACQSVLATVLETGNVEAIKIMKAILLEVPPNQRGALLQSLTQEGLELALQSDQVGAIEAYGELMELVPPGSKELFQILETASGAGLTDALKDGKPRNIEAFGKLLKFVSPQQRFDLLARFGKAHTATALKFGQFTSYDQYVKLLDSVPAGDRRNLLMPDNPEEVEKIRCPSLNQRKSLAEKTCFSN